MPNNGSTESFRTTVEAASPGITVTLPKVLQEAAVMAAFVIAILGTNLVLANYPNVKMFDTLVFVAGYTLGFRRGALIAATAWIIYGTANPFGTSGMLLLGVQIVGKIGYALAGSVARNILLPEKIQVLPSRTSLMFGILAVLSTLTYDVMTNIYTALHWATLAQSTDYFRWIVGTLFNPAALFFASAHLSSNVLFFAFFAPLISKAVCRLKG
ncbi:MAG: hypothetical protein VX800_02860 [Chloroflexota bacterium]|nr:hypothetical protein [Chloroflexota bacterium]